MSLFPEHPSQHSDASFEDISGSDEGGHTMLPRYQDDDQRPRSRGTNGERTRVFSHSAVQMNDFLEMRRL